jgi:hypothetical protein
MRFDVGEDLLHCYCNVDRVTVYATAPVNVAVGARILRQIDAGARGGVKNHAPDRLSSVRRAITQQSAGPSRHPVPDMPPIQGVQVSLPIQRARCCH